MKKIIATCLMLGASFGLCAQSGVSERDRKFVTEAAATSLMEIKLGELAQHNGSTAEIKN